MIDRPALLKLLGPFPARVPLEARVLEVVDCGSYLREKVAYSTEREERISAYVCIPKHRSPKTPAVYCPWGSPKSGHRGSAQNRP
jgi:cephalosporin-C deacetylase-like acetyl esterase